MSEKKQRNILGKSGNFHRKEYMKLVDKGMIKIEMGATEQKRILEKHYTELGYNVKDFELNQIYDLGVTKLRNNIEKENGKRKILTVDEKKMKANLKETERLAVNNRTGKKSARKRNREFNKKYEKWKIEKGYDTNRNNQNEIIIINEFLKHLKEDKNYKDSTIDNYRQAIHTEQEDIFRKAVKQEKQQVKFERNFTRITKNRRIPIEVSKENMKNFNHLSSSSNKAFSEMRTKNRQGDVKKFQQQLVFDTYMAEYKGYQDHNQIKMQDVDDFFKWLKTDKEVDGKVIKGLSNNTCKGYKTAINQYSIKSNWEIAEELNKTSVEDFGVGKVHKKVVQRSMTMEEVDKMLTLAFGGTTKNKANPNYFVGYEMLMQVGAGLRDDEAINLTLKQVKDMLKENEAILELTKTKGSVPREVHNEVLKFMNVFLEPCKNLIKKAELEGLKDTDKPLIELFPKNKARAEAGKTHLIKAELNSWFKNHRDKFQDSDRVSNREISRINDTIKNKEDVDILKGDLTPHSGRHTFANILFSAYKESFNRRFTHDEDFRKQVYKQYKKERTRGGKVFNPKEEKMDYYMERGLHIYTCKQVSKLLGHGRYEITETYIVTKDRQNKSVIINLQNFNEFELGVDEHGDFYTQKQKE